MKEEELYLSIEKIELEELLHSVRKNFELQAERKKQQIIIKCEGIINTLHADKKKICDVFHNLLSNALKYSHENTTVIIIARESNENVEIEFRDQGQGMNENDLNRLFMRFAKLSAKPTGKESSTGLGLFIAKSFIEMHNGTIHAISRGKSSGSSFFVTLPLLYLTKVEPALEQFIV